jgi:hypothetical protein
VGIAFSIGNEGVSLTFENIDKMLALLHFHPGGHERNYSAGLAAYLFLQYRLPVLLSSPTQSHRRHV